MLHGGFLSVVIAWHEQVFDKVVIVSPVTFMLLAAIMWLFAASIYLWVNCPRILQQDIPGAPPWYYYLLAVPLCIYAFMTPWAVLQLLGAIRLPIM
ncbi:MAG: hypothetical protein HC893_08590 [Chloroflexaceae bacterium]|nr:hypothetical protein [Chloroflexaceae bacterium]